MLDVMLISNVKNASKDPVMTATLRPSVMPHVDRLMLNVTQMRVPVLLVLQAKTKIAPKLLKCATQAAKSKLFQDVIKRKKYAILVHQELDVYFLMLVRQLVVLQLHLWELDTVARKRKVMSQDVSHQQKVPCPKLNVNNNVTLTFHLESAISDQINANHVILPIQNATIQWISANKTWQRGTAHRMLLMVSID